MPVYKINCQFTKGNASLQKEMPVYKSKCRFVEIVKCQFTVDVDINVDWDISGPGNISSIIITILTIMII